MPRRAMPAKKYDQMKTEKRIVSVKDGETAESPITNAETEKPAIAETEKAVTAIKAYVKLIKLVKEEQKVTGVVLEPDVFDAQKTIITAEVIRKAAHGFLAGFNITTKLGVQHEDFKKPFELCESYIAPIDFVLGDKTIKKGSWVVILKVLSKKIWEAIKNGKITGFSIGGKAKIKKLKKEAA